ncbi:substrate-binding periplasmic protein [Chloroflexota bacterium]
MARVHNGERSLLDEIRDCGRVRITAHWGDTSAQYLDPDSGEPAGMVGLVGQLLARDLGVKSVFIDLPWADHIPTLLNDRADLSIKHTNTPQRAFDVEFTVHSILCEEGRIVIRHDRGLYTASDLNHPGRTIAVTAGASQISHIHDHFPLARIQEWPTAQDALDAVAQGKADASLHDTKIPGFLLVYSECTVLSHEDGQPRTAYVDCVHPCIKPGDPRFLNWLNNWMAFRKASGTFERLIEQAEREYAAKQNCIIEKASERQ